MERLLNMKTAFKAGQIRCGFNGDKFTVAISTNKNLFEIGSLFRSLDDSKQVEQFFEEIVSILYLIEYFKLNERLGL